MKSTSSYDKKVLVVYWKRTNIVQPTHQYFLLYELIFFFVWSNISHYIFSFVCESVKLLSKLHQLHDATDAYKFWGLPEIRELVTLGRNFDTSQQVFHLLSHLVMQ